MSLQLGEKLIEQCVLDFIQLFGEPDFHKGNSML